MKKQKKMNSLSKFLSVFIIIIASITSVSAQAHNTDQTWNNLSVASAAGLTLVWSLLGTFALFLGFKLFDRILTGVALEHQIAEKNVAASIFSSALLLALAIIIAAAIMG